MNIVVTFDDTKDPNELSGINITNSVFGAFEYTDTKKFHVVNYGSTFVAQPIWADKFNEAVLEGEVRFEISATGLRIYYDNDTKSVTLSRD